MPAVGERGSVHWKRLVLPDRIELSTSPLPRECSTTELRQQARDHHKENRPGRRGAGGRFLPQGPPRRKQGGAALPPAKLLKSTSSGGTRACLPGSMPFCRLQPSPAAMALAPAMLHLSVKSRCQDGILMADQPDKQQPPAPDARQDP